MRRLLCCFIFLSGFFLVRCSFGQSPKPSATRLGFVMAGPSKFLVQDWDQPTLLHAVKEKAYCVIEWWVAPYPDNRIADTIYRIWKVVPALVDESGNSFVNFACPKGSPPMHTHPPSNDGISNCSESIPDKRSLESTAAAFGVIECGPGVVHFYWRETPIPDSLKVADTASPPPTRMTPQ
jgi:hypothetical protein